MSKVIGGLFSKVARGKFGKTLIFQTHRSINYVKIKYPQKKSNTPLQVTIRIYYGMGLGEWRALSIDKKNFYRQQAKGLSYSGFNLFIKFFYGIISRKEYGDGYYGYVLYGG